MTDVLRDGTVGKENDDYDAIKRYWGSVSKGMLSLYMAGTGGEDWGSLIIPLRHAGIHYHFLFLLYVTFFMFVVVNTMTSLLIEAMIANSTRDRSSVINEEMHNKTQYINEIRKLHKDACTDASGILSWEEFRNFFNSAEMVAFTSSLDIDLVDARDFFSILSNNGTLDVDAETFVVGCMKLRGSARSVDLYNVQRLLEQVHTEILFMKAAGSSRMNSLERSDGDHGG